MIEPERHSGLLAKASGMNATLQEKPTEFAAHVAARKVVLRTELASFFSARPAGRTVTLEIGCGHGHFLVRYASVHPDKLCLGIDLLRDRIVRSEKKRHRARLTNLHFIRAEAGEVLDCLPADVRLDEVFVLFPDPWPKRRHHKHRLIQPSFLEELGQRAGEGARLYFRTDHSAYFTAAKAVIAKHHAWRPEPGVSWPFEEPTVFQQRAPHYDSLVATKGRLKPIQPNQQQ